jgi:hypothetical protein
MAGGNRGLASLTVMNARVGNGMSFVPAHLKNGLGVNDCVKFSGLVNLDGGDGEPLALDFTAWGRLARMIAFGLPKGTTFFARCRPNSYRGRVYEVSGHDEKGDPIYQPMMKADGTGPRTTQKVGFTIISNQFLFGDPSQRQIDVEIAHNLRDPNWNSTPEGKAAWKLQIQERQKWPQLPVDLAAKTYGYARLQLPTGAEMTFTQGLPEQHRRTTGAPTPRLDASPTSANGGDSAVGNMAAQVAAAAAGTNPTPAPNTGAGVHHRLPAQMTAGGFEGLY